MKIFWILIDFQNNLRIHSVRKNTKEVSEVKITEKNVIKQLNKGNEAALEYVMVNYGGLVKAVVRRHLYNLTQYEEDCINEVFFAVWNHISSYQEEKNTLGNWIAGVARLKALDYVRKYAKRGRF